MTQTVRGVISRAKGQPVEGLDHIEDAFHKMHAGEVLRSVVVL
ncbi:hypothetical protein [Mycolicibacterium parafortuitum]